MDRYWVIFFTTKRGSKIWFCFGYCFLVCKVSKLLHGFLPYFIGASLVTVLLLAQPDFGTYMVIMGASFVTFFVGGARKRHIYYLVIAGLVGFVLLVSVRPYMLERIKTFINATHDPQGSSWQVNQSLIALGGGGLTGRGLGQSVQKFNY